MAKHTFRRQIYSRVPENVRMFDNLTMDNLVNQIHLHRIWQIKIKLTTIQTMG